MEVDGVNLAIGGGAVTAIAGVVGAYIKAKFGKTEIPQPMETQQVGPFVTCGECKQHRQAIGKRIDTIETSTRTIINKLDEIDTRAEQRSEKPPTSEARSRLCFWTGLTRLTGFRGSGGLPQLLIL